MIIKILGSAASFKGMDYSLEKREANQAKLTAAVNFPFESSESKDHKKYLQSVALLNEKVKNKQFHATVSTKGKNHTFKELTDVAKDYMDKMGYGNTPYVVFSHSDTANNHVHIVGSRVNRVGKKIDDSHERIKTQKYISEHLGIKWSQNSSKDIVDFMDYTFTTKAQLENLFKASGYSINEKDGKMEVWKNSEKQGDIDLKIIQEKIDKTEVDKGRKKQLVAILKKYAPGNDLKSFSDLIRRKFGAQIILHYPTVKGPDPRWEKRSNKVPFGYTVVDHKNRNIFKGSDIIKLKELEKLFYKKQNTNTIKMFVTDALSKRPNLSHTNLKKLLNDLNINLDNDNILWDKKTGEELFKIDRQSAQKLFYNQKVSESNKAIYTKNINPQLISRAFKIQAEDLNFKPVNTTKGIRDYYRHILLEHDKQKSKRYNLPENISIISQDGKSILYDSNRAIFLDVKQDLGIGKNIAADNPKNQTKNLRYPKNKEESPFPWATDAGDSDDNLKRKRRGRRL